MKYHEIRPRGLIFAIGFMLLGCTNAPTPQRSHILADTQMAVGIVDCSRHGVPLSTNQLVEFAGEADTKVKWEAVHQTLAGQPGMNDESVHAAIEHMRRAYSHGQGSPPIKDPMTRPVMDQVEVWLYLWKEPARLSVCGLFDRPAGRGSIAVLIEKESAVAVCALMYE